MYYTLGQRQGLHIGGRKDGSEEAWYVVAKDVADNKLIVAQGEHELLFSDTLVATDASWIGPPPERLDAGLRCAAKIRYRQDDQSCVVTQRGPDALKVAFDERQKAAAPGQFVVFYQGDLCLGGAVIDATE
jgi:tRNA-specific 2-thiouridylase